MVYLEGMQYFNRLISLLVIAFAMTISVPALADGGEKEPQDVDGNADVNHDDVDVDVNTDDSDVAPSHDDAAVDTHDPEPVAPQPVDNNTTDSSTTDNSVTYEDHSSYNYETSEHHVVDTNVSAPISSAKKNRKSHDYWNFRRFGLGAGASFAGHDRDQLFKLDFNAGPLQVHYYSDPDNRRNIAGLIAPSLPLYMSDRHPVSFVPGAGVQYAGRDSDVKMNVMAVGHLDVGLFKNFHLRAGPSWFIPTNIGDTGGIDGDDRRLAAKRPRGDVVLRVGF